MSAVAMASGSVGVVRSERTLLLPLLLLSQTRGLNRPLAPLGAVAAECAAALVAERASAARTRRTVARLLPGALAPLAPPLVGFREPPQLVRVVQHA